VTAASQQLTATVTDDSGTPTIAWTVVSAGTVAPVRFSSTTVANPTISYPRNGTYNLRITATDAGGLSSAKDIAITVNAPSPFTIQGTVADNAVAPQPGVVTTLKWLVPTTAVVAGTVTTNTATGAFSHAGLIGSPTDFQVEIAGTL
jgi:large repetitive protein